MPVSTRSGRMAMLAFKGLMLLTTPALAAEVPLPGTQDMTLMAAGVDKPYRIMVAVPDAPAPSAGYPVIYALDGNSTFGSFRDEVRRQLETTYKTPAIVVAIGYPGDVAWNDVRRDHDLTPKVPGRPHITGPGGEVIPDTGGADAFLTFIETVVKPKIEATWAIDRTQQTLTGHSFGGLFTLHTFFTRPQTFQTFVAMSPSIWFADNYLLEEEAAYRKGFAAHPDTARLLITVGGCEQTPGECDLAMPSTPGRDAWLPTRGRMVDNARDMQARLTTVRGDAVQVRVIDGEHHISVIGASVTRAVRFALTSGMTSGMTSGTPRKE